jgi:hypothetical protein
MYTQMTEGEDTQQQQTSNSRLVAELLVMVLQTSHVPCIPAHVQQLQLLLKQVQIATRRPCAAICCDS